MTTYIDSSFLVSIYLADTHSVRADQLIRNESGLVLFPLHIAEWAHALAQQVFRGTISSPNAMRLEQEFADERRGGTWRELPMPERAFELCADLARRHGPKLGVRTLDSLHVACAIELKAERFWTFDERQAKLARAEGLKVS